VNKYFSKFACALKSILKPLGGFSNIIAENSIDPQIGFVSLIYWGVKKPCNLALIDANS